MEIFNPLRKIDKGDVKKETAAKIINCALLEKTDRKIELKNEFKAIFQNYLD